MGYIGNHPNLLKIEEAEQEKIRLKKIEIAQRDQKIAQRDKLIKIEERKIKLAEQGNPEKNSLVTELCDFITSEIQANAQVQPSEEIHDHPPSPATRKTKVLNEFEAHYKACVKKNGNQLIRFGLFKKTERFLEIKEWGEKEHGVTVEKKSIEDRMRKVNSDLEISKLGASTTSERKPKTKTRILKKEKVDLDKLAEDFLEDDI